MGLCHCLQEMHAEFESMLAYMLAAKEQASNWLQLQVEVAASMRTFVSNLDALLNAHGVRLHLNSQRHHTTVRHHIYVHSTVYCTNRI